MDTFPGEAAPQAAGVRLRVKAVLKACNSGKDSTLGRATGEGSTSSVMHFNNGVSDQRGLDKDATSQPSPTTSLVQTKCGKRRLRHMTQTSSHAAIQW